MQVTEHNDVRVYNLSAGKNLAAWLDEAAKNKQSLRYNEDYRRRIDLIQDFEFNIASARVRMSPDGEYAVATGTYGPEIRIFETRELGLKHTRGLNAEAVDFLFLSEDYKKLVFLLDDRTIEFHAQYGRHHRMRVPKHGRSLGYDHETCHLFVGGTGTEVTRVDLEAGTFLSPVSLRQLEEVNQLAVNPALPVLTCVGNAGLAESFDVRDPSKPIQSLQVCPEGSRVNCCAYSEDGMHFVAGAETGLSRVYDVRSNKPITQRDMMNGYGVRSVKFHNAPGDGRRLLVGSCDSKSVKVWDASTAALHVALEHPATINQMELCPNSGLLFLANDQPRMGTYFIPSLGVAPKWCSFLDSMTEELEESVRGSVFSDYQFVTKDQLEQLGAKDLLGTTYLQPYMHGYFMDHRMHARLKAAMEPFAFEEYRRSMVKKRLEEKRPMRRLVKTFKDEVNPELKKSWQVTAEEGEIEGRSKKVKDKAERAKKILDDDRFRRLFADPDFTVEASGAKGQYGDGVADSMAEAMAAGPKKKKKKSA